MTPNTQSPAPLERTATPRLFLGLAAVVVVIVVVLAIWLSRPDEPVVPGVSGATGSSHPANGSTTTPAVIGPTVSRTREAPPTSGTPTPSQSRSTRPVVPLTEANTPAAGVAARVVAIEAVTGKVQLPGEIAGPALKVTVEITNSTGSVLDTNGGVVNLYGGPRLVPAIPLSDPPGSPFPDRLEPGQRATGSFVFNVPIAQRDKIRVEVDFGRFGDVVLFEGPVR